MSEVNNEQNKFEELLEIAKNKIVDNYTLGFYNGMQLFYSMYNSKIPEFLCFNEKMEIKSVDFMMEEKHE